jgi:ACS family tartrate transporter-like MFS transporter
MDRANISFAAESMNRQLHFSPHVYGLGAGLFFITYALCEIPSNALMLRFGARRWLARIMLTWGLLAAAMVFVSSAREFYGVRLLLGCAEAGYFPGALYCLSQWFPAAQRAKAISWFYISLPLSSVLMGLVAGDLLKMDGRLGMRGWQWLFLVEAMPAVVLGVCLWFALPDRLTKVSWMTEDERAAIDAEIAKDDAGRLGCTGGADLGQVLREPAVWVMGLFGFCMLGTFYSLNFFLPLMVRELTRWTPQSVGFAIAVSGVLGAAAMVLNASHSDRSGDRRWHIVGPVGVIATLLVVVGFHMDGLIAALGLLSFAIASSALQGPMLAIVSRLCAGRNAALAIATFNMCSILGGFVGPYWMGWMRELTGGYAVGIGTLCVPCVVAACCIVWVTREPVMVEKIEMRTA